MAAYAIFAISFILRPLGGIFGATLGTSLVEKMHYLGRLS
jgi:putative Mn2+ efflux pump MntP